MIKLTKETFLSPLGIFFLYIFVSALVILGFRMIFPGEAAPLAFFSFSWRLLRGVLNYLTLFPALALSSLVIPFGFGAGAGKRTNSFSPEFFLSLKMSIITAITGAFFFGLFSFLVLPLARDYEANLRFQGRLYRFAEERAAECTAEGAWVEAAHFLAICEKIWPGGPDVAKLKIETDIQIEQNRVAPVAPSGPDSGSSPLPGLPRLRPVSVTEALEMAETALADERYFDAHWLATLGSRLARPDSVELAEASRLAGRAWNEVNSMAPNAAETRAHNIFRLKRDGYEALLAEKWIQAYFTFRELLAESPEDPDAETYLAVSESGLRQEAFFIDEIEFTLGKILVGAVFSLPGESGRLVMRIASLSTFPDSAYGMGIEILAFDREGRPLWSMEAPYAKILPLTLDSGPGLTVLMRALDRADKTKYWEPETEGAGRNSPAGAQIFLNVSWDNFLLLSDIHRGLSRLPPAALLNAAENLENYGCQREVFESELLRRFAEPLLLLPFGIFTIVLGWRYRALKRPRYMGVPMLVILPAVFNGTIYFFRGWINNLGIWAVISAGFTSAAVFFGIGAFALLLLSMIILAAQHG